jgi:PBP1b-binding outer membrane lipoprotein LpoB
MKKLFIFPILICVFLFAGCEKQGAPKREDPKKNQTIFEQVEKACDGNDMIYFTDGYREIGLAVVENHEDCQR